MDVPGGFGRFVTVGGGFGLFVAVCFAVGGGAADGACVAELAAGVALFGSSAEGAADVVVAAVVDASVVGTDEGVASPEDCAVVSEDCAGCFA